MMTTDALMWKTWKMSSLPMPYNWRILRRSKTRVTFKYWTQYLIFTTTYKHEELINPHYDHLLSTFFFTDLFLFFIFNICKALFQAHTNCHFFKNTLQWFFLFPIWPWFPSHLTYLVFFPHSVNIGDFSFSCATSPPLGNLTYFHSFNYCNFRIIFPTSWLLLLPFSGILAPHTHLPHTKLGFHSGWFNFLVVQHLPHTSFKTSVIPLQPHTPMTIPWNLWSTEYIPLSEWLIQVFYASPAALVVKNSSI